MSQTHSQYRLLGFVSVISRAVMRQARILDWAMVLFVMCVTQVDLAAALRIIGGCPLISWSESHCFSFLIVINRLKQQAAWLATSKGNKAQMK